MVFELKFKLFGRIQGKKNRIEGSKIIFVAIADEESLVMIRKKVKLSPCITKVLYGNLGVWVYNLTGGDFGIVKDI